ncbi:hypothetical protein HMSSN036_89960 [Paenibacillus macerans]|nr:hypothetical protein HMSSN036_89960 [Paenibacillus macerans]
MKKLIRFKRFRKNFSLGMSILLVLTFVPATYAENAGAAASTSLKSSSPQIAEAKIDDKLTTQFKQDDYVTYLVKLKEQTDTASVSKLALQKAATQKRRLRPPSCRPGPPSSAPCAKRLPAPNSAWKTI